MELVSSSCEFWGSNSGHQAGTPTASTMIVTVSYEMNLLCLRGGFWTGLPDVMGPTLNVRDPKCVGPPG